MILRHARSIRTGRKKCWIERPRGRQFARRSHPGPPPRCARQFRNRACAGAGAAPANRPPRTRDQGDSVRSSGLARRLHRSRVRAQEGRGVQMFRARRGRGVERLSCADSTPAGVVEQGGSGRDVPSAFSSRQSLLNPEGIAAFSPAVASLTSYPGLRALNFPQP